jgi:hypothetical protein
MIEKNNTWEFVDCPHGKDIIGVKLIFNILKFYKLNKNTQT